MRFWFRFVFPFQDELKTGLTSPLLYDGEIADVLADHVSPTFERLCREWARRTGAATRVGSWWGNALNELRREGTRQTEEIDVVALSRSAWRCGRSSRSLSGLLAASAIGSCE